MRIASSERVIGEAEIIVGRKIQERFAADLEARRLRRIDATQLAQKILFAKRVEPLLEFDVKFRRQPATKFSVTENESNEELRQIPNANDRIAAITISGFCLIPEESKFASLIS